MNGFPPLANAPNPPELGPFVDAAAGVEVEVGSFFSLGFVVTPKLNFGFDASVEVLAGSVEDVDAVGVLTGGFDVPKGEEAELLFPKGEGAGLLVCALDGNENVDFACSAGFETVVEDELEGKANIPVAGSAGFAWFVNPVNAVEDEGAAVSLFDGNPNENLGAGFEGSACDALLVDPPNADLGC